MTNRNFQYAPGLPGYGNKGVDGSTGLQGLAMYFSEFDGVTDTITIKNKIISNKILFSADELLPGYPERTYKNGDLFIDVNGLVWVIDFAESNKYVTTGASFAANSFFEHLKPIAGIGYDRYFPTDKNLIDIVASTSGAIDYTTVPDNIYLTEPDQFAQWKYVNILSSSNTDNYYPFTVFTIGSGDNDAIAITRDQSINNWHLGNLDDNGVLRDVNLQLDFMEISPTGDISFKRLNGTGGQEFNISIATDSLSIDPADLILTSWTGIDVTTGAAGRGGDLNIYAGDGGDTSINSSIDAGYGGNINLKAGKSGTYGAIGGPEPNPNREGHITLTTGTSNTLTGGSGDIYLSAGESGPNYERGNIRLTAKSIYLNATDKSDSGNQTVGYFRPQDIELAGKDKIYLHADEILLEADDVSLKINGHVPWKLKRTYWGDTKSTWSGFLPNTASSATAFVVSNTISTGITRPGVKLMIKFGGVTVVGDITVDNFKFFFQAYNSNTTSWDDIATVTVNRGAANKWLYLVAPLAVTTVNNWNGQFRVKASYTDAGSYDAEIQGNSIFEVFINE